MQQLSFAPTIEKISSNQNLSRFFNYLNRPSWFKDKFIPEFDTHRKLTDGMIFLMLQEEKTIGCIYCELNPHHTSYGEKVPIFGWIQAESEQICHKLLETAIKYAKDNGFSKIRGPINPPKLFGGWGAMVEGYSNEMLVESAINQPELAGWIISAGFNFDTEYVAIKDTHMLSKDFEFPGIELNSYPIKELMKDSELILKLGKFVTANFTGFLPDNSIVGERTQELFDLLLSVDRGEDFLGFALDSTTDEIAAVFIVLPNVFEIWQGQPLRNVNADTAIVAKKYRNSQLFHYLYNKVYSNLRKSRGFTGLTAGMVWSQNVKAIKSFTKIGYINARFHVFLKEWEMI
jgi:hypothetical protein